MKIICTTDEGHEATLKVMQDRHGTPQIYLFLEDAGPEGTGGEPCHGWGTRKREEGGFKEGVLVRGGVVGIPEGAWLKALHEREDLRNQQNLPHLRLVKVYSRGDRLTLDGYTLNARTDKATWSKIAHLLEEVDSTDDNEIIDGDHFIGWLVKPGMEEAVEEVLRVEKEKFSHKTATGHPA